MGSTIKVNKVIGSIYSLIYLVIKYFVLLINYFSFSRLAGKGIISFFMYFPISCGKVIHNNIKVTNKERKLR